MSRHCRAPFIMAAAARFITASVACSSSSSQWLLLPANVLEITVWLGEKSLARHFLLSIPCQLSQPQLMKKIKLQRFLTTLQYYVQLATFSPSGMQKILCKSYSSIRACVLNCSTITRERHVQYNTCILQPGRTHGCKKPAAIALLSQ